MRRRDFRSEEVGRITAKGRVGNSRRIEQMRINKKRSTISTYNNYEK